MVSYVSYQSSEMIATNHMNLQLSSSNHFSIWPQMQPCKWSQLCHRFMSCHVCTNFDRSHSEAIVIMFHLKKRWFIFNASLVSRPVKQTNPLHVPRGNVGNKLSHEKKVTQNGPAVVFPTTTEIPSKCQLSSGFPSKHSRRTCPPRSRGKSREWGRAWHSSGGNRWTRAKISASHGSPRSMSSAEDCKHNYIIHCV